MSIEEKINDALKYLENLEKLKDLGMNGEKDIFKPLVKISKELFEYSEKYKKN